MALNKTGIEWLNRPGYLARSWNPIRGCSWTSPGCDNCYAGTLAARFCEAGQPWHGLVKPNGRGGLAWTGDIQFHPEKLREPAMEKRPAMIFVCSASDWAHPKVPEPWIRRMWTVMDACPWHTFILITKRARRARKLVSQMAADFGILPNVWGGVTVEDQERADTRMPDLEQTPWARPVISLEPLLGPVDLFPWVRPGTPGHPSVYRPWLLIGGESGMNARLMDQGWARDLARQGQAAGCPVFMKQMGTRWAALNGDGGQSHGAAMERWPADLQVRQAPWDGPPGLPEKRASLA